MKHGVDRFEPTENRFVASGGEYLGNKPLTRYQKKEAEQIAKFLYNKRFT